ncbi:hypothetical protein EW026_g502 [Hermanssonia centrifuga]|uniref:1-phosphatidylinositol-3-phosphate 5-kinase n=1 Tax=Hermanssonia centrifuga TaxID=98765 RepID=A0A4S4KZ07_9APHY|nr:hypothetical protein EW026_g502 [Hermanssonia centrifuga]
MLTTENIPNVKEWEETLLRLALRIARELTFTAHPHREGADMDVRRYVKIKKVPGGAPSDSEYVDGAVITKNVAHKSMLRTQRNPRVMLVTFPLEFHRIEGQYVHFGQILMQEKDYLGNLASRIAALRPHVVLVENSPSAQILLSTTSRDTPGRISIFTEGEDLLGEEAEQKRLSRRIEESLEPYEKTFISVSATLRFPPPYPIRRMKELDDELVRVKREWEDDLVRREEKSTFTHQQEETVTEVATPVVAVPSSINTDDLAAQIESLPIPQLPGTPTPGATTPSEQSGYFDIGHNLSSSSLLTPAFVTSPAMRTPSEESPIQPKTMDDIALESRLSYVQWQHAEQCRIWEWYLRKNKDDFDAEKYQCISLWEFTLPIAEYGLHRACFPPQLNYITFYGDNDCTLGQFIEKSVRDTLVKFLDPKAVCEGKGCGQPISRHCKVYVHHETRLFVAVEQWDGQITDYSSGFYAPASAETIVTWSACRLCGSATPFIPVSEEMQRYSFAKFLELHFYPADVQLVQGAGCQHNIYKDHIRYFAYQGMTVRFQADPVVLHEIVYPPMRIRVRPETQLEIKNRDFERLHHRNHVWYSGLIDDLKLINIDAATGDEATDAILTAHINTLILRAEWEKDDVARYINKIYSDSPPTDTLALNQLRAKRQDLIVAWQLDFDRLPKPRITQLADRNGRRMSSAFGTVRAMWPRRFDFEYPYTASANISEAEDYSMPTMRRVTGDSFASASEASETESTGGPEQELAPPPETQPGSFVEKQGIAGPTGISPKSDPGSDSTVAAPYGEEQSTIPARVSPFTLTGCFLQLTHYKTKEISLDSEQEDAETARPSKLQSRLPRRAAHPPSVAELVKRYQEYLPPLGVEELAKTAMSPAVPVSEGEQDAAAIPYPRTRMRSKTRQLLSKRPSMSDFEQSYAANIAPKYLTHARRAVGQPSIPSRIPGPAMMTESRQMSRRPSPDKRPSMSKMHTDISMRAGRSSPPPSGRLQPSGAFGTKGRGKSVTRPATKEDKARAPRQATVRRPTGTGSKVSNIAKHFERITRDNERANRRYAVIRGRRARPVATARAKVEILDSITDAIKDEEESDGSDSSEADDEGGDEDENDARRNKEPKILTESPQAMESSTEAESECQTEGELEPATLVAVPKDDQLQRPHSPTGSQPSLSIPPSPALPPISSVAASPPVELELGGTGSERISILKTLAGFWPQQPQPSRLADMDDPMADPEHIFRDSSMVVRTDEPTSIIALALNSPQYRDMLAKSRAEKRQAREPKLTDGGEAFMPDDKSVAESTSTWGVVNVDSIDGADPTEELRVPSSKLPWAISAHMAPFYLREHSKRILRGALYNDSKFLADINVMDYSLVVGVDSVRNELVVGIVDYIRTYTWDKKLESWVKDSAFLGGANKGEPTIIGPRQYRQRFLSAMERYFPLVPDRWMKQHDAPEEEGNNLLDLWPDW